MVEAAIFLLHFLINLGCLLRAVDSWPIFETENALSTAVIVLLDRWLCNLVLASKVVWATLVQFHILVVVLAERLNVGEHLCRDATEEENATRQRMKAGCVALA